jgi:hypothetical protein
VAELAERVETARETERVDIDRIAQTLEMVDQLSEGEVKAMLAERGALASGSVAQ